MVSVTCAITWKGKMEMDNGKIFSASGHLTHEAMFRYHSHALSREDEYAIEKHMAGCSLCAEAMEGTEKIRKEERYVHILAELRRAVRRRTRRSKPVSFIQPYIVGTIVFLILFLLIIYIVFFRGGIVK